MVARRTQSLLTTGWLWGLGLSLAVFGAGCHDWDDDCGDCDPGYQPDVYAPAAPRGVTSITGDRQVEILWFDNTESDLDGYRVYRNDEPDGYFTRIATLGRSRTSYVDTDVANGETYYYAVAAYDRAGNESDLSYDLVFDTPRPEGRGLRITNSVTDGRDSGYDFSARRIVNVLDQDADIYYWHTDDDGPWLVATERSNDVFTDIQDAGYGSLDSVGWAPDGGWAPTGDVPLIEGHVYVVWTWDDHYAKVRVVSISPNSVVLDWAYQTDRSNPELRVPGLSNDGDEASIKAAGGGQRAHRVGQKAR